jgi:hypothetical protein
MTGDESFKSLYIFVVFWGIFLYIFFIYWKYFFYTKEDQCPAPDEVIFFQGSFNQ